MADEPKKQERQGPTKKQQKAGPPSELRKKANPMGELDNNKIIILSQPKELDDGKIMVLTQPQEMKTGGRAGYKMGSKGCKLAIKGKGNAYGKNS